MDKLETVMNMDTWLKGEQIKLDGNSITEHGKVFYTGKFISGYQEGKEIVVTDDYLDVYINSIPAMVDTGDGAPQYTFAPTGQLSLL